jgi:hypothetical protein
MSKLWKRDTTNWTVREVEGEPYPGRDSEGDVCYVNSHFPTENEAWESLKKEVEAWVSLAGRDLTQAEAAVRAAQAECGKAAVAFEKVAARISQSGERECSKI